MSQFRRVARKSSFSGAHSSVWMSAVDPPLDRGILLSMFRMVVAGCLVTIFAKILEFRRADDGTMKVV